MSRFQASIDLGLSYKETHAICVTAILELGWHVANETDARIFCQEAVEAVFSGINPVRIALSLSGSRQGPTRVILNGAAFGSSVTQWGHVRERVEILLQAIQHRTSGKTVSATTINGSDVLFYRPPAEHARPARTGGMVGRTWTPRPACSSAVTNVVPGAILPASMPNAVSAEERASERRSVAVSEVIVASPS